MPQMVQKVRGHAVVVVEEKGGRLVERRGDETTNSGSNYSFLIGTATMT